MLRAGKRCTTFRRILCHWRLYVPSEWCLQEKGMWSYIACLMPVSNRYFRHYDVSNDGHFTYLGFMVVMLDLKLRELQPQLHPPPPPLLLVDKIQIKSCRVVNVCLNSEALKYNSVGGERLSTILWSWIWSPESSYSIWISHRVIPHLTINISSLLISYWIYSLRVSFV